MTKNTILFLFLSILLPSGVALGQQQATSTYSGGMLFLQPGFTMTSNKHQKINDFNFGLGGILRLYLSDWLTTGVYGGTQKTGYTSANSDKSTLSLGFGGAFLGYSRQEKRLRYTASALVGRGNIHNLHIERQIGDFLSEAYLYDYPVWVFSPILSIDYALTQRLQLTVQGVCPIARYNDTRHIFNPTLQIGLLFSR